MPKVTVLMAVYNGERYLREAIESILTQTFQDFEFLIINDSSTDSTREIICSYADPRIELVDNEHNIGLTKSLNKGWRLAKGELIARQDGDDISEPERLARQVAFLEENSEIALLGSWYKEIDEQGNFIRDCNLPCESISICWEILFYCPFVHSAVMFRKQTISEQIGFYDEAFSYAQDYDLWWRIARNLKVANISESLIRLRTNPLSMTATYGNIVDDEPLKIKTNNIQYLLGYDEARKWNNQEIWKAMSLLWLAELEQLKTADLQTINQAITHILKLNNAFNNYYKLDFKEQREYYNKICIRLSNQLINLAYYYLIKDKCIAWWLLIEAFFLRSSILKHRKNISLLLKLVVGSWLIERIKYLTQGRLKTKHD